MEPQQRLKLIHVKADPLLRRVVYRLVQRDLKRNPDRYKHRPSGVLALAEDLRFLPGPNLFWYLLAAAKALGCGFSMLQWRDELTYFEVARAMHKQRPQLRPRR